MFEDIVRWLLAAAIVALGMYGWMPVCWAICKIAGWI